MASLSAREEAEGPSLKMSLPMISWCFAWDCFRGGFRVMMMSTRIRMMEAD